jgi:hypothetical protein
MANGMNLTQAMGFVADAGKKGIEIVIEHEGGLVTMSCLKYSEGSQFGRCLHRDENCPVDEGGQCWYKKAPIAAV